MSFDLHLIVMMNISLYLYSSTANETVNTYITGSFDSLNRFPKYKRLQAQFCNISLDCTLPIQMVLFMVICFDSDGMSEAHAVPSGLTMLLTNKLHTRKFLFNCSLPWKRFFTLLCYHFSDQLISLDSIWFLRGVERQDIVLICFGFSCKLGFAPVSSRIVCHTYFHVSLFFMTYFFCVLFPVVTFIDALFLSSPAHSHYSWRLANGCWRLTA